MPPVTFKSWKWQLLALPTKNGDRAVELLLDDDCKEFYAKNCDKNSIVYEKSHRR